MNSIEFKKRLKADGLEIFYAYDDYKEFISGDKVYFDGVFHNTCNVYGVYQYENGQYAAFVTDRERGLPRLHAFRDTEEDAFEYLYKRILAFKQP